MNTAISIQPEQHTPQTEGFAALKIAPILKENLARARFITPTAIQQGAIPPALEGRDVLGTAQTGTGKTLAFLLPILERLIRTRGQGIEALVLLPTRELALQVADTLQRISGNTRILAALLVGGLSETRQLDAVRMGARIAIATPGRLNDFLNRRLVRLDSVKILVLDEADRMVDMGFLPQIRNILAYLPAERQTMCFSATLDASIAHLVHEHLKDPVRVEIGAVSKAADSVDLKVYEVMREQKFPLLNHLLETEKGTFLVFARTKFGADKLARKLVQKGIDAGVLHGGRTQSQRTRALEGFKRGHHRVLIATDIAARGIHVNGIAHVVNYDLPQVPEDFVHRVGRTGRMEQTGTATTFVTPQELGDIRAIERNVGKRIERLPLPEGLPSEPRSLHDEAFDMRARGRNRFGGTRRHFGRRRY